MKIRTEDNIIILDWMMTDCGIKSVYELLVFAIIFGLSNGTKEWMVDLEYLTSAVGRTKARVLRYLENFERRGLVQIRKEGDNMYVLVYGRK